MPTYQELFPRFCQALVAVWLVYSGTQGNRALPTLARAPPSPPASGTQRHLWLRCLVRAARRERPRASGGSVAVPQRALSPANPLAPRGDAALVRTLVLGRGIGMASVISRVASAKAPETSPTALARGQALESGPLRRGAPPSLLPPRPPIMAATYAPMGTTSLGPASWIRRERRACGRSE